MTFDLATAAPVDSAPSGGFDLATAKPVSDRKSPAAMADDEPGWADTIARKAKEIGRQIGLTGRYAATGVAALPLLAADAPTRISNLARSVASGGTAKPAPVASEIFQQGLDELGFPRPQGGTERVVGDISTAMAGAGGSASLAGQVAKTAASPVTRAVATSMAQNPGLQVASGAGGAGAGGTVREAGGGPVAQTVADLVGAAAIPGTVAGAAGATRRALRGSAENIPSMKERMAAFKAAGTEASAGQATESRVAQGLENTLAKVPGGAGPMAKKAETQAEELGAQATKIADGLAPGASPFTAGNAIEKGLTGPGGFVSRFKGAQKVLYDKLDAYVPQDAKVKVSRTQAALKDLNADIEGAPALSKWFKNAKIQGLHGSLDEDLHNPSPTAKALDSARAELKSAEKAKVAALQTAWEGRTFAAQQENLAHGGSLRADQTGKTTIAGQYPPRSGPVNTEHDSHVGVSPSAYPNPQYPRVPGRYTENIQRVPEGDAQFDDAMAVYRKRADAVVAASKKIAALEEKASSENGTLPYEAVKKLRTLVGNEIADHNMASDVPRSKWKALYGALSQDLDGAAAATGNPEAVKAMQRANTFTKAGHARIDAVLDKVIGKDKVPENIFKNAVNSADMQAGASKIGAVMKSLSPAERDVVKSAFIGRMGRAAAGNQGKEGDAFSSGTFLTNWNKMSPNAKAVMFSGEDGKLRENLDAIAYAADNIKRGSKVFSNPSGTAQGAASIGLLTGTAAALGTGRFGTAAALLGAAGSANLTARLMTNPKFVDWLATETRAPKTAVPAAIATLATQMKGEPDDVKADADRYAESLTQGAPPK